MKKLLLTAVCVSVLTLGVAHAQSSANPENMPPHKEMRMHENLVKKLNLTDEQKKQADKIREDGRKAMEPLMQEKKVLNEKMDTLRKANMEEFEKILTPEQQEEFKKIKEKRLSRRMRRGEHKSHDRHIMPEKVGKESKK